MGLGSGIRDPGSGINLYQIPDPGIGVNKAPDPGTVSAILQNVDQMGEKRRLPCPRQWKKSC
jgi:hypothetical protein